MADELMQATFDATLDEVVDVGMRLSTGTNAYHRQRGSALWRFGVLFIGAALTFYSGRREVSPLAWLIFAVVIVPTGAALVVGYQRFHDWYVRRAYRRMVSELFGGAGQTRCDFYVHDDRLLCKTPRRI